MKDNLKKNTLFLALICIVLFFLIFKWIDFLFFKNYIVECFTNDNKTHSVDLPLTTKYSCKNFCNPASRCAITGQQCLDDLDCPGCTLRSEENKSVGEDISGNNSAGKMTVGITPQYSDLTNGFGTKEKIITNDFFSKPPSPNFGVDIWTKEFQEETALFNKRYKPKNLHYNTGYSEIYSLSGEFIEDGPFPSNYELDKLN